MPNVFTLSGTSLDAQNNPAYVGRYMVLRITSVGTDTADAASYPQDSVSFLIDENGDWTSGATLWVNGDSGILSYYEMLEPSGQRLEFVFPSAVEGTTVRYEYAIENYLAEDAAEQQSPALAAHIADTSNPHSVTTAQLGIVNENGGVEIGVGSSATTGVAIGTSASTTTGGAVGSSASTTTGGAVGSSTSATTGGAVGNLARSTSGFAGGFLARADGTGRVQLGTGTNNTDSTIQFLSSGSVTAAEFGRLIGTGGALYYTGGTDIAIADGGTGASNASDARDNLGFDANTTSATTTVTSTTYTALSTDKVILVDDDTAGGDVTISLPSAATLGDGWGLAIKKLGTTGDVIIDPDGTETLDGETTRTVRQTYETTRIISDGTNWMIGYPTNNTGWAQYTDGDYTSGSPLAVNNAKVQLTIDPATGTGSKIETYLPPGVTEFWNATSDTIIGQKEGDAYTVRINFVGDPGGVTDYAELIFDIGDGSPDVPIVTRTISFAKATATSISETISLFALDTFITNGCKIYLDTSGSGDSIDVYDISVIVTRTHSPH